MNAGADSATPIAIATLSKNDDLNRGLATRAPLDSTLRPTPPPQLDEPALRVLLSSVEMTVNLLDAYGHCRDEGMQHQPCMSIIRTTLSHARNMIGDAPSAPLP
jgi:hypothetical protein